MSIIDFHTHAYIDRIASRSVKTVSEHYSKPVSGNGTIGNLEECAKDGGVDYILVLPVAPRASQVVPLNNWLAKRITDHVLGFGCLHPKYKHLEEEAARIKTLGLRGIKLHPDFQQVNADDPSMDKVYDLAVQEHLPVLIHAGDVQTTYSNPARIANVMKRFPEMTLIVPHLGGYSEWDEAERYIIGKDCYIDTSSSLWALPPEKSRELILKHGVDRVLFGTDYPLTSQIEEIRYFKRLHLTEEAEKRILFENAKELLHLQV